MKDLCQKWKVELLFFETPAGCHGTGIVERFKIIDLWCNLKQFDGLTWLTLTLPTCTRTCTQREKARLSQWAISFCHRWTAWKKSLTVYQS